MTNFGQSLGSDRFLQSVPVRSSLAIMAGAVVLCGCPAANQQTATTGMSPQEQQDRSVCLQHAHKDSGYNEKAFASCMAAKGYKKDNLYPSETTADAGKPSLSDMWNGTLKKLTPSAGSDPNNAARPSDGENTGQEDQSSSH
jgi:hypothetical protein